MIHVGLIFQIHCGRCNAKLGSFSWNGAVKCGCGGQVSEVICWFDFGSEAKLTMTHVDRISWISQCPILFLSSVSHFLLPSRRWLPALWWASHDSTNAPCSKRSRPASEEMTTTSSILSREICLAQMTWNTYVFYEASSPHFTATLNWRWILNLFSVRYMVNSYGFWWK